MPAKPRFASALFLLICCVCLAAFATGTDIGFSVRADQRPGPAAEAAAGPRNRSYLDAQSRSGPTAPPGALAAEHHAASAAAVVIPGVPAYLWRQGCGPTAAGMLLGYWDAHGFPDLVPGDASTQTDAVNAALASDGPASNYSDYCLPKDYATIDPSPLPDKSEYPFGDEHPDDCLADLMKTSQSHSQNYYGWSWFSDLGAALERYVTLCRPTYHADVAFHTFHGSDLTWDALRAEIDAQRPAVLFVDVDGHGGADHFVTAVGYDTANGAPRYGCLDTWDTDVHWFDFAPIAEGQRWGVFGAITLQLGDSSALLRIEPASSTLLPGTDLALQVVLDNVVNLGGFQFTLGFDPAVLRIDGASLGSLLTGSGRSFTAIGPAIHNAAGTLTFGAYSIGAAPVLSGSGVLAILQLHALATGSSNLAFSAVQLSRPVGVPQAVTSTDGSVTVTGSAQTRFVYLPIIVRQ